MCIADQHVFQVLTKRPERMTKWVNAHYAKKKSDKALLPQHIWLGTSVESQDFTFRIEHLQKTNSTIRFLSIEPLLGPVSLTKKLLAGVHWVIVGGESGNRARPMDERWVVSIQKQCEKYDVPFFFKQWGAFNKVGKRVGKKKAGRTFKGTTWNEMPATHRIAVG